MDAIGEYKKRLSRYCKYEIIEVKDEKTPQNASNLEEEKIKEIEGERILGKIKEKAYVIALAIEGGQISSEGLAKKMSELETRSRGNLYFVIGGSLGLSSKVLSRADEKLSFSLMTFPHQLMQNYQNILSLSSSYLFVIGLVISNSITAINLLT